MAEVTKTKKFKKDQGLTYCRPEKKGMGRASRTSDKWCIECGKRKRGDNHNEGSHHNAKAKK